MRAAWWCDFDPWPHGGPIVPLRGCGYAARGLWAGLLCIMEHSEAPGFLLVYGRVPTVTQLTGLVAAAGRKSVVTLLKELSEAQVFRRTGAVDLPEIIRMTVPNGMPDGVIFEPRMARRAFEWNYSVAARVGQQPPFTNLSFGEHFQRSCGETEQTKGASARSPRPAAAAFRSKERCSTPQPFQKGKGR